MPPESDALVATVQERLGIRDRRQVETIIAQVLRPLWERLGIGLSARLSETLPTPVARRLRGIAAAGTRFAPVATYLSEVAAAERANLDEARRHALVVFAALAEVLPGDVLDRIAAEVPALVGALFPGGPAPGQPAEVSSSPAAARSMADTMSSIVALPLTR
jgi:uncharacterized protein (DUF2267 family)